MNLRVLGRIGSVPGRVFGVTAVASATAVAFGVIQGWSLWAVVSAGLAIWVPLFVLETTWIRRHYGWISLFFVLVVTQGGHVLEHVVQMLQIHVLDRTGPDAQGVFGALDIEWVHFIWNTWVFLAIVTLLVRFRRNPWLWVTFALAAWHQAEHTYIMSVFLTTGTPGTPGLAGMGGRLAGGLPVTRPDLHFLYNLVETTPLCGGVRLSTAPNLRRLARASVPDARGD